MRNGRAAPGDRSYAAMCPGWTLAAIAVVSGGRCELVAIAGLSFEGLRAAIFDVRPAEGQGIDARMPSRHDDHRRDSQADYARGGLIRGTIEGGPIEGGRAPIVATKSVAFL